MYTRAHKYDHIPNLALWEKRADSLLVRGIACGLNIELVVGPKVMANTLIPVCRDKILPRHMCQMSAELHFGTGSLGIGLPSSLVPGKTGSHVKLYDGRVTTAMPVGPSLRNVHAIGNNKQTNEWKMHGMRCFRLLGSTNILLSRASNLVFTLLYMLSVI